jgi:hypothetical protein
MPEPLDPATIKAMRKDRGWSQPEGATKMTTEFRQFLFDMRLLRDAYTEATRIGYAPGHFRTEASVQAADAIVRNISEIAEHIRTRYDLTNRDIRRAYFIAHRYSDHA